MEPEDLRLGVSRSAVGQLALILLAVCVLAISQREAARIPLRTVTGSGRGGAARAGTSHTANGGGVTTSTDGGAADASTGRAASRDSINTSRDVGTQQPAVGSPLPGGAAKARLVGRFWPGLLPDDSLAELPQFMTFTPAAATVAFKGSRQVSVVLDGSLTGGLPPGSDTSLVAAGAAMFQFELDGEPLGIHTLNRSNPVLEWTWSGVSLGSHTLTITKISEAKVGVAWLQRVSLSQGGQFLVPPLTPGQASGRRIMFIGDSFTVGMSNTAGVHCNATPHQNSMLAWPMRVARRLHADYDVVAWSGGGLHLGRSKELGSTGRVYAFPSSHDLLLRTNAINPAADWDASSWQPQVVVVAGGINDITDVRLRPDLTVVSEPGGPGGLPQYSAYHVAFMRQLRQLYPQAAILQVMWSPRLLHPRDMPWYGIYAFYMAAAFTKAEADGIGNLHYLQIDAQRADQSSRCLGHPGTAEHDVIASEAASLLRSLLPAFGDPG